MTINEPNQSASMEPRESEIRNGLTRILEITEEWQRPLRWTQAMTAVRELRRYRIEMFILQGEMLYNCLDDSDLQKRFLAGQLSEVEHSDELKELADLQQWHKEDYAKKLERKQRYKSLSDDRYSQIKVAYQELNELMDVVRQYAPQLLEYVPDVDFGESSDTETGYLVDAPTIDHDPLRRDLRKLEGQVRVLLADVDAEMLRSTTGALENITIAMPPTSSINAPDTSGDSDTPQVRDSAQRVREDHLPFGMTIDAKSRSVSRFIKGIDRVSSCEIDNEDQWQLFLLLVNKGGEVTARGVQNLLPSKSERDNNKARLVQKLNKLQLTIVHMAKTGYVLKEV